MHAGAARPPHLVFSQQLCVTSDPAGSSAHPPSAHAYALQANTSSTAAAARRPSGVAHMAAHGASTLGGCSGAAGDAGQWGSATLPAAPGAWRPSCSTYELMASMYCDCRLGESGWQDLGAGQRAR